MITCNEILDIWLLGCLGVPFLGSILFYLIDCFGIYGTYRHYSIDGKRHVAWIDDGSYTPGKGFIGALHSAANAHMFLFCLTNTIFLEFWVVPFLHGTNVAILLGCIIGILGIGLWIAINIINLEFIMCLWRIILAIQYLTAICYVIYYLYQIPF